MGIESETLHLVSQIFMHEGMSHHTSSKILQLTLQYEICNNTAYQINKLKSTNLVRQFSVYQKIRHFQKGGFFSQLFNGIPTIVQNTLKK